MSAFSNLTNIAPGCSDDGVCRIEPFPFNLAATVDMIGGTMGKIHATDSAVGPKKSGSYARQVNVVSHRLT